MPRSNPSAPELAGSLAERQNISVFLLSSENKPTSQGCCGAGAFVGACHLRHLKFLAQPFLGVPDRDRTLDLKVLFIDAADTLSATTQAES
jgi:hypothetical protein